MKESPSVAPDQLRKTYPLLRNGCQVHELEAEDIIYAEPNCSETLPKSGGKMVRERWTDERIDRLADSVDELRDSIDGLRVTSQALLQVAAQHQQEMELIKERQAESDRRMELLTQRQAESDARFNVLLEEVRYLIRRDRED
jgi:hypothetical protein